MATTLRNQKESETKSLSRQALDWRRRLGGARLIILAGMLPVLSAWAAEPLQIYRTGFEAAEGYLANRALEGQGGWLGGGYEDGDNGVSDGEFAGYGQQAYVGGSLAALSTDYYFVYRPIQLVSVPPNIENVHFSVLMSITASNTDDLDNFYWTLYNDEEVPLFTIDFDNYFQDLAYWLEGAADPVLPEIGFERDAVYRLDLWMDFAHNQWHGAFGGVPFATNRPAITTTGAALTLGDIEAAWNIYQTGQPGDNSMIFDEYEIVGEPYPDPPVLSLASKPPLGNFECRVTGIPGRSYVMEFTSDWDAWNPISTNTVGPGGVFDFIDRTTAGTTQRFYRARLVP